MFEPLSREFLLNRGFCCENKCLNCPYEKNKYMNFNEWLKSQPEKLFGDQEHFAKLAWIACKNEVLHILKENKIDNHTVQFPCFSENIEEEIENL